jgi:hypothetical protein
MNLELTDDETAALLRELDGLIDSDRYFHVAAHQHPEGNPSQDQAGAGAQAVASATEAICATSGDSKAETRRRALSGER